MPLDSELPGQAKPHFRVAMLVDINIVLAQLIMYNCNFQAFCQALLLEICSDLILSEVHYSAANAELGIGHANAGLSGPCITMFYSKHNSELMKASCTVISRSG